MNYSISEFSAITNLGIHTLRYYEKENLISPARKDNSRRIYSENDIIWIQFVKRLKDTGMPIKEIKKYTTLRAEGNSTLSDRMEMLIKHRLTLSEEILKLQEHLEKLDCKIEYYQTEIEEENNKVSLSF